MVMVHKCNAFSSARPAARTNVLHNQSILSGPSPDVPPEGFGEASLNLACFDPTSSTFLAAKVNLYVGGHLGLFRLLKSPNVRSQVQRST